MTSRKADRASLFVPYIFLIAGALGMAGAIFSLIQTASFLGKAIVVEARVVDLAYVKSDGSYAPIVTFGTEDGTVKTMKSKSRSKPAAYSEGDTVKVAYLRSDSDQWIIMDFWNEHLVTVILGFLGMVFSAVGGVFVHFLGKRNRANGGKARKRRR